jgi:hypothetical protein
MLEVNVVESGEESREGAARRSESLKMDVTFLVSEVV